MKNNNEIKWGERIAFVSGEIYGGGAVPLLSGIYFTFLISVIKIAPWIAGLIVLLSKLWDAFTDPVMGVISDNTRCKYGRRKPYILASSFLVVIAMMLLFAPGFMSEAHLSSPTDPLKITLALATYLFYNTISTIFNVPYISLTSEISNNIDERSFVNTIRIVLAMISGGICFIFPTMVYTAFDDGKISLTAFYWITSIVFGLYFAIPMLCVGLFSKERVPYDKHEKSRFNVKQFVSPLKVKAFVLLIVMYIFSFACMDIIGSIIINFVKHTLGGAVNATFVYVAMMVAGGLTMPIAGFLLSKGLAKVKLFMIGIPFYIVGVCGMSLFPTTWNANLIYMFALIAGVGFGCVNLVPWLVYPDIVDIGELKQGKRNAGSFSGIMTFMKKAASGLGVFIVGIVLSAAGFDETKESQPESAILALRLCMLLSVVVFLIIAFIAASRLKLNHRLSSNVKELIDVQREKGELTELTAEQSDKFAEIEKKLF